MFDVIEGVVYVPEVVFEPVQASDAVQLVVFVDDHVSFDVPPDATDVGDADNVSVGAVLVDPVTVTEAVRVTEPPLPVHVSVKLEFVVSAFVVKVPERAVRPDHAPEAAQLSAYADFQVSCDVEPDVMEVGDADNVSAGTAAEAEIGAINNRAAERTIDETSRRRNPPGLSSCMPTMPRTRNTLPSRCLFANPPWPTNGPTIRRSLMKE